MNARGALAVDIMSYFFSVISPHTKERGPFLVQQEVDGTTTVCLTIRPLHANAAIGTPHHTASGNSRDEAHARQLVSLQMLQHLETQGILPDDWWRWPPGWLNSAEPSVLRFVMLAYLLILKEHCWVARKSVIKFRISAEARFVAAQVLDTLLQEGSVVENSQQQVRLATTQEFGLRQHAPPKQQLQREQAPPRRVAEPVGYQQQPYAVAAPPAGYYADTYPQARLESSPPPRYERSSSRDEPYMPRRDDPPYGQQQQQQQQAPYYERLQQQPLDVDHYRDGHLAAQQAPLHELEAELFRNTRGKSRSQAAASHDYGRAGTASYQPASDSWRQQQQQQQGPGSYQRQPYSPRGGDRGLPQQQQQQQRQQQVYSPRGYQQPHQQVNSPHGYQQQLSDPRDYQQPEQQRSYPEPYSQRSSYIQPPIPQPLQQQPVGYSRQGAWQQDLPHQARYQQQTLQGSSNSSGRHPQHDRQPLPVPVGRFPQRDNAYARPLHAAGIHSRPAPVAVGVHGRSEPHAAGCSRPDLVPPHVGFAGQHDRLAQQLPHQQYGAAPVGVYGSSHSGHSSQLSHGRSGAAGAAGWTDEHPMQQQHWHSREREWIRGSEASREIRDRPQNKLQDRHQDRPQDKDRANNKRARDSNRGGDGGSRGSKSVLAQHGNRPAGDRDRDNGKRDSNVLIRGKDGRDKDGGNNSRNKRQRQDTTGVVAAAATAAGSAASKWPAHDNPQSNAAAGSGVAAASGHGHGRPQSATVAAGARAANALQAATVAALPPAVVLNVPQHPLTPRELQHVVLQLLEAAAPFPVELDMLKQRFAAAAGAADPVTAATDAAAVPGRGVEAVLSALQDEGAVEVFAVVERQQTKQLARTLQNGWSQQVHELTQQQAALQEAQLDVPAPANGAVAAAGGVLEFAAAAAAEHAGDELACMAVDVAGPAGAVAEANADAAACAARKAAAAGACDAAAHIAAEVAPASCTSAAVVPRYRKAAAAAAAAKEAAAAAGSTEEGARAAAAAVEAGAAATAAIAGSAVVLAVYKRSSLQSA